MDKILDSKIQIPEWKECFLVRKRLLQKMENYKKQLVILHGGVGCGKTVLLTQYANLHSQSCAWYHLEEVDNDVQGFFKYLNASIRKIWNDFWINLDGLQHGDTKLAAQRVGIEFAIQINEHIKQGEKGAVLILDNFQTIHHETIFSIISLLIQYTSKNFYIYIATKSMIPIFCIGFFLNEKAGLLEMEELAFTKEEIEELLGKKAGCKSAPRMAADIYEKTGGWPAGTALAVHHIKQDVSQSEKIDWGIVDYEMITENYVIYDMFCGLSVVLQQFLIKSSVLQELDAQVCNYVLNMTDAKGTLHYLFQENLFIDRVEGKQASYRYQPVFKMFLEKHLSNEQKKMLLQRASTYYAQKKDVELLMDCYIRCDDFQRMEETFAESGEMAIRQGQAAVEYWISYLQLKEDTVSLSERSCYLMALYFYRNKEDGLSAHYAKRLGDKTGHPEFRELKKKIAAKKDGETGQSSDAVIRVQCFGEFEVYLGKKEEKMGWRTKKTAELFAFLVERGGKPVNRNELLRILWPEEYPNNAVAMLHNMIYHIRRKLEEYGLNHLIQYEKKQYRMDVSQIQTQLEGAERICSAVKKRETEYLKIHEKELMLLSKTYFLGIGNVWCDERRYYYEKIFLDGCRLLGETYINQGENERAALVLKKGLLVDRYSEEMVVLLLKCYAGQKNIKEGKQLYEDICRVLKEELNVPPWKKLTDAYQALIHLN